MNYIKNNDLSKQLTGVPTDILNVISDAYEKIHYKQNKLSSEALLLTLPYRHYPSMLLLATIFQISKHSAHRIKNKVQTFLYTLFKPEITMMDPKRSLEEGHLFEPPKLTFISYFGWNRATL
ncbi:hypothetical protein CYY_001345 [Polysphondylium violaceum]|uniref:Transposase Helix-turn-helix domain-containing protein n=1 Tax=Polysphondylium violaceum TaxID=133409 RepID=A0A8J4V807_9MYCE|nr:hypothetical protein CYY_001345 [Polysphondylium violaceum]